MGGRGRRSQRASLPGRIIRAEHQHYEVITYSQKSQVHNAISLLVILYNPGVANYNLGSIIRVLCHSE